MNLLCIQIDRTDRMNYKFDMLVVNNKRFNFLFENKHNNGPYDLTEKKRNDILENIKQRYH